MTAADEIDIQKAEIRHQYNLMMELKEKMKKEKELLELQIRENYVLLIDRKKVFTIDGYSDLLTSIRASRWCGLIFRS